MTAIKAADGSVKFQSDIMSCSNLVISPQDVTRKSHNMETTEIIHAVHAIGMITLRLRQYGQRFPDGIYRLILLQENYNILIQVLLKIVTTDLFDNNPALIQVMAWN